MMLPNILLNIANIPSFGISGWTSKTRTDLLKVLKKDSDVIQTISDDFRTFGESIKIYSFYEDTATPPFADLVSSYRFTL